MHWEGCVTNRATPYSFTGWRRENERWNSLNSLVKCKYDYTTKNFNIRAVPQVTACQLDS